MNVVQLKMKTPLFPMQATRLVSLFISVLTISINVGASPLTCDEVFFQISSAQTANAAHPLVRGVMAPTDGGVSLGFVEKMQTRRVGVQAANLQIAAQKIGIDRILAPAGSVPDHDTSYTKVLPIGPIDDQGQAGICWESSSNSTVETFGIARGLLPQGFKLSRAWIFFWDMLEQSDAHIAHLINFRVNTEQVKTETLLPHFEPEFTDGDFFQGFQFIAGKYGLVPESAMPSSMNMKATAMLQKELHQYLQVKSMELWDLAQSFSKSPTSYEQFMQDRAKPSVKESAISLEKLTPEQVQALQLKREEIISGVWKILETALGRPPTTFQTKLPGKPGTPNAAATVQVRKFKPREFMYDYLKYNPYDFVELANFPNRPKMEHYASKYNEVVADRHVINVGAERLKELIKISIDHGYAVWFSADIEQSTNYQTGIMHQDIIPKSDIYGMTNAEKARPLTNSQLNFLGRIQGNHAMVFFGYDQPEGYKVPRKYADKQSWSEAVGSGGIYHTYPSWIDNNVESIVVPRSLLNEAELHALSKPPIRIKIRDNPH